MNRYVVVVDDDIDPADLEQVVWAMSTRSDPARDIEITSHGWGSKLDPLLPEGAPAYNSRAVVDACRPFERRADFPSVAESDPSYLRELSERWGQALTG
jgi:4-hydroxy-3-polyprenylbenzoate decarboxylase